MSYGTHRSTNVDEFALIRSKGVSDAVVRLTSLPLLAGLERLGMRTHDLSTEAATTNGTATVIMFHYDDAAAATLARALKAANPLLFVVCLGADIYSYDHYTVHEDFTSLFCVPTDLHRKMLAGQLMSPAAVLSEALDSTAAAVAVDRVAPKGAKRVCWFGYSESFGKAMASLMPVVQHALNTRCIDDFVAILDTERFQNRWHIPTLEYDPDTFASVVGQFDYVILSHFSLDLSINSYIKSPNKALTALALGVIPLATDTPAYGSTFRAFNLERFLFSSPMELYERLHRLSPTADAAFLNSQDAVRKARSHVTPISIAEQLLRAVREARADRPVPGLRSSTYQPMPPFEKSTARLSLREHIVDLLPSAVRSMKARSASMRRALLGSHVGSVSSDCPENKHGSRR